MYRNYPVKRVTSFRVIGATTNTQGNAIHQLVIQAINQCPKNPSSNPVARKVEIPEINRDI